MKLYDLHAHILPHMDHGCGRTTSALAQLDVIQENGTHIVAATSHFYPQDTQPDVFLEERQQSVRTLLDACGERLRPKLLLGAEVLICPGLENMGSLRDLCYAGTNILLLEMPFTNRGWDRTLYHTLHEIKKMGIRPLLAHVDRYPAPLIEGLFSDMGLYGQINADALARLMKPKHILRWMENGHIIALGSDLHGRDPKSYNAFAKLTNSMTSYVETVMQAADHWFGQAELI